MYRELLLFFNRVVCLLSLCLCLSRILCVCPRFPLNLFLFSVFGFLLLPHFILIFTWYQSVRVENLRNRLQRKPNIREEQENKMDRCMASSLPTEKLDRRNYASWSYKMHQYLLGHGYWNYVDGANDIARDLTHRHFPAWE